MTDQPTYVTPEQAAERLGWATKTIYRWLRSGWFSGAVRLPNGRWRIPEAEVEAVALAPETEPAA